MPKKLPDWKTSDLTELKPFSNVSLVAFDVDGTLQSKTRKVYDRLIPQIRKLNSHSNKVEIVIATGRTLFGLWPMLQIWEKSENLPLVLYNGGVVLRAGTREVMVRRIISNDDLNKILLATKKYNAITLAYFISLPFELPGSLETKEWVIGWHGKSRYEIDFNGMKINWSDSETYSDELSAPTAVLIDLASCNHELKGLYDELRKISGISVTSSGGSYIEIRPLGSDKGVALKEVAEMLCIPTECILALGDGDNDFEMLRWAGIGVAVDGATEMAISASDYICNRKAAEGAVEVLHLVHEAKRYFSNGQ